MTKLRKRAINLVDIEGVNGGQAVTDSNSNTLHLALYKFLIYKN